MKHFFLFASLLLLTIHFENDDWKGIATANVSPVQISANLFSLNHSNVITAKYRAVS